MARFAVALAVLALTATALAVEGGLGRFALEVRGKGAEEHCFRLEAGQSIRYRFSATGVVDFNIHFHRGAEVVLPVERKAVKALDGVFRAETTEDFCLMWERRAADAVKINGRIEARKAAAR